MRPFFRIITFSGLYLSLGLLIKEDLPCWLNLVGGLMVGVGAVLGWED